jgi:CcmD family protein
VTICGLKNATFANTFEKVNMMRMMKLFMKKTFLSVLLTILPLVLLCAQNDVDFMRSMSKMYVVVAVIAVIFLGIVIFMIYIDRRLTKLENQIKNHE